ncbi:MAG: threonylcarbamoyl-AMP synthase [Clostridia bacterium]|nr:threonylcarbamoyl-AMP synthase [Clostridia bacterium]
MKTEILKPNKHTYKTASILINKDELVAFPTETVYGLGASALSETAVKKIFDAKGRPQDNPLIVHLSRKQDIKKYVNNITKAHKKLIQKFMPGPISIIFDKNPKICSSVCAGGSTVAIRIPENKVARKFIKHTKLPICAPSANTSKRPSPTTADHVFQDMNQKIPLIIDGGSTSIGIESTVVRVDNNTVYILRPGKISKEMIAEKCKLIAVDKIDTSKIPQSPGTKYAHYKPNCDMIIVKTNVYQNICNIYNNSIKNGKNPIIFCKQQNLNQYKNKTVISLGLDSTQASTNLFDYLRKYEHHDLIICEYFDNGEMIDALFNRMLKSASGNLL